MTHEDAHTLAALQTGRCIHTHMETDKWVVACMHTHAYAHILFRFVESDMYPPIFDEERKIFAGIRGTDTQRYRYEFNAHTDPRSHKFKHTRSRTRARVL